MKEIPLTKGYVALVDDADYEDLIRYKWHADVNNCSGKVYASMVVWVGTGKRRQLRMHRYLTGNTGPEVDHWDDDGLNNQRHNLRVATKGQNNANRRPRKTNLSGFKGVNQEDSGTFKARITVNGKSKHIGTFLTRKGAAMAYDCAAREAFGGFARLNFPLGGEAAA